MDTYTVPPPGDRAHGERVGGDQVVLWEAQLSGLQIVQGVRDLVGNPMGITELG